MLANKADVFIKTADSDISFCSIQNDVGISIKLYGSIKISIKSADIPVTKYNNFSLRS